MADVLGSSLTVGYNDVGDVIESGKDGTERSSKCIYDSHDGIFPTLYECSLCLLATVAHHF